MTVKTNSTANQGEHQQAFKAAQLNQLMETTGPAMIGSGISAIIAAYAISETTPSTPLLIWVASSLLIVAARWTLTWHVQRQSTDINHRDRWLVLFSVGVFLSGLLWGASGFLVMGSTHDHNQHALSLLVLFAGGLSAGAAVSYAAIGWLPPLFYVSALVPLSTIYLSSEVNHNQSMGWMVLVFMGLIGVIGRNVNRSITDTLKLRLENIAMGNSLEASRASARKLDLQLKDAIEGHRSAERELRESEEKFRALVEQSEDGILLLQKETIQYSNKSALRLLGYSQQELLGQHMRIYMPDRDSDLPELLQTYRARMAGEPVPSAYESKLLRKDGTLLDAVLSASVIQVGGEQGIIVSLKDISSFIATQKALSEKEANLTMASHIANLGYISGDRDSRIIQVSQEAKRILGLSEDSDTIGLDEFRERIHPEEQEGVRIQLRKALKENSDLNISFRILLHEEEERNLHIMLRGSNGMTGETKGFFGVIQDVTEQYEQQEALRYSEERLAAILDIAEDAIISVNEQSKIILFNRGAEKVFGYSVDEALGQSLDILLPDGVRQAHHNYVQGFQKEPEGVRSMQAGREVEGQRKGGETFPAEASISKLNFHGTMIFTVTLRDITQRKKAEAELLESEERYRNLVEGSAQGICIHDGEKPLFVNKTFAEMFGFANTNEVLNLRSIEMLVMPESVPELEQHLEILRNKEPGKVHRYRMMGLHNSGKTIHFDVLARKVNWDGQTVFQETMVDITGQLDLERQLRQSQKMEAIGHLAGGVAHDFNNMLQIINGYTELSLGEESPQPKIKEYLELVRDAGEKSADLTRQLLAFSRQQVMTPTTVDINELIPNEMKMITRMIGRDIELALDLCEEKVLVHGDRGMLQQVILNLSVNARDAMPMGGQLNIQTESFFADKEFCQSNDLPEEGPFVLLSVSDTGTGIPKDVQERVFEPFFTTKEAGKGTGLGLATVYGVVHQHGGTIKLYSEEGMGTTFHIYLPLIPGSALHIEQEKNLPIPGGRETILLAEDEPGVRALAVEMLEAKGYNVIAAVDGEEAMASYSNHHDKIHLAVLDVIMPKKNGRQVYEHIQAHNPDLPILFSTGYAGNAFDDNFLKEFQGRIINKPYRPKELLLAIREELDALRLS